MIDLLIVKGTLKPSELADTGRTAQVALLRPSVTKFRPSVDYVESPLTGAQLDITISNESSGDREDMVAKFRLPLASSVLGQNWMHGWTENLEGELKAASLLARVVLTQYEFSDTQLQRFIDTSEVESAELTWHIQTASFHAAHSLLERVRQMMRVLYEHNQKHDVGVEGYSFYEENLRPSLKVFLKDGNALKFYVKVDEMDDTRRRRVRGTSMHPEFVADQGVVRTAIENHLRVEVIPCKKYLKSQGIANPKSWTADSITKLIDDTWTHAGFNIQYEPNVKSLDTSKLRPTYQKTYAEYLKRGAVTSLADAKYSRHRTEILKHGVDISIGPSQHAALSKSIGRQLHYSKRWKAPGDLRPYMMSEATLPTIIDTLTAMAEVSRQQMPPEVLEQLADERLRAAVPRGTNNNSNV